MWNYHREKQWPLLCLMYPFSRETIMPVNQKVIDLVTQYCIDVAETPLIELSGVAKATLPNYLYVAYNIVVQGPEGLLFGLCLGYAVGKGFSIEEHNLNTPGVLCTAAIEIIRDHAEELGCNDLIAEYDEQFADTQSNVRSIKGGPCDATRH